MACLLKWGSLSVNVSKDYVLCVLIKVAGGF
jgi:hypothetical protein